MKKVVDLMLDSGVFSAYSRGQTLDLKKYIDYVKANKKFVSAYVNMDDIPGKIGKLQHTQAETLASAEKSYANLQIMKEAGLRPVPVFHRGEPIEFLERMLADGDDYIGLAAGRDNRLPARIAWLDNIFDAITDSKGRPLVKVHGFGITQTTLLTRYPWYSCDSTTWKITPGYGLLIIPPLGSDGKFDYLKQPFRIPISGRLHSSKLTQSRQFDSMAHHGQTSLTMLIERFLDEECGGLTLAMARYDLTHRFAAGLAYFQNFARHLRDRRFKPDHRPTGFGVNKKVLQGATPPSFEHLKIIFVTLAKDNRSSAMLTRNGADTRLLSYYELMNMPPGSIQKYVETGAIKEWTAKIPPNNWDERHKNFRIMKTIERAQRKDPDDEPTGATRTPKDRTARAI